MQLIDRTIEALLLLSKEPDGMSVSELAKRLEISSSSTHRILTSLKAHHFVLQASDTKKYRLGYKVLTLGTYVTKQNNFTLAAKPHMEHLANQVNETVALCVMEGENVICLDYVESPNISQFMVRPGIAMPPHTTSAGKAILAYRKLEEVKRIYNSAMSRELSASDKDGWADFVTVLKHVQTEGYAISDEELQVGVQGVACPIFDYTHNVIGSVSITALKNDTKITAENIQALKACADAISISIGGTK